MSFSEALAWLRENAGSWTHSNQQVYSRLILDELDRLNGEIEIHVIERRNLEDVRKKERRQALALDDELRKTREELEREKDSWAAERTSLETSIREKNERIREAENTLKDVHYALLKQPELKREEIAHVIESVVTPYPEGEKP